MARVPKEEGKFNVWYQSFAINLPTVAADVGVVASEMARVDNDSAGFNYLILRNAAIRAYKDEESKIKERAFDEKSGGDAMKEIIGDALRNAAMRFGAALDLWHKGELHPDEPDAGGGETQQENRNGNAYDIFDECSYGDGDSARGGSGYDASQ